MIEGTIERPGDVDSFRFKVRAGQQLAFEIETTDAKPFDFIPRLAVLDGNGEEIVTNFFRRLDLYGRPNRQSLPQRDAKANLRQALHLLAGPTYTDKLTQKGGRVERLLKNGAATREVIEELYLAALSRFPVAKEYAELEKLLGRETSRRQAIQNLLWAVLNSREFSTNH